MTSIERLNAFLEQTQDGIKEDAQRGILRFSPDQFDEAGRLLFEGLKKGGFATFVVPGRSGWDPESPYYEVTRKQARAGKNITRLFLLPHRHYLREPRLRKHWQLDSDAGIKVKFSIVDGMSLAGLLLLPESLDFGIWDDELVCWVYKQSSKALTTAGSFTITNKREHLDLANKVKDALLSQELDFLSPGSPLDEFALEEPLIRSASTMALLSEFLCKGGHVNPEDCHWYHASWQYLRLLDLVSTPTWHSSFYLNALKSSFMGKQICDVLISGTADYSMLAYVLHVFSQIGIDCNVLIVDLCETPLTICRWYASSKKVKIETCQEDILKFEPQKLFDCVITDAFITRFPHSSQPKILEKWSKLLSPDGRIITTIRVDPRAIIDKPVRPTPQEILDFVNRAENLAELWKDFVLVEATEIGSLAKTYAERMESYSAPDRSYVEELFSKAGLEIGAFEEKNVKGEMTKTIYAEIVARKVH